VKKIILFIPFTLLFILAIIFTNEKNNISNSQGYKDNKEINALLSEYSVENGHEFQFTTKKIEKTLYGKWQVKDDSEVGRSLKYDITGDALYKGKLELSKELFSRTTPTAVWDSEMKTTGEYEDYTVSYKNPVFVYYNETLGEMAQDDFLDNYSGIEGLSSETMGTVIVALGMSTKSMNKYEIINMKFILVNDYVIAVNMSTFYQLQRIE
jgi:hypothetical protein